MSLRTTNKRLRSSIVFVVVVFALLIARAVEIQVVEGAEYAARADRQHIREFDTSAKRGVIYDRNGEELAVSQRMATVVADPQMVEDAAAAAAALGPILGVEESVLREKLESAGRFVYLARKLEPAIGEQVSALKIRGVAVQPEEKRVYPKGSLAPQVLGFVGMDNIGLAGMETQYDEQLRGQTGRRSIIGDPFGRTLGVLFDRSGREGDSLVLTIDEDIQYAAEHELMNLVERYGALGASAVVLDPRSGEILAMANVPLFDTNRYGAEDESMRRNAVVTDQFEPGSTFKMVVVAAALEADIVDPDTTFDLGSSITLYDRTVHEAHEDVPASRTMSVTEILAQSSNVGAVTLGLEVGEEGLVDMIERFGFTRKTGIDFPGEAAGYMLPQEDWSGTTIANIPIGQGISVTPLQLAAAYGAIANDGVYIQPHLAKGAELRPSHQAVSPEVARQLRDMLLVTVSAGTGKAAAVKGYSVAGKTGTAQKAAENGRGYSKDRFIASFIGMVPAEDPALVVLVVVDEPTLEYYGSVVAAPAFAQIADFALRRLEIPPTISQ